jgi:hypothetical protein
LTTPLDGLIRALGALRAESFALEYDHPEAQVLEEAARHALRDAAVRSRELLGADPERQSLAARELLEQIGGLAKSG